MEELIIESKTENREMNQDLKIEFHENLDEIKRSSDILNMIS